MKTNKGRLGHIIICTAFFVSVVVSILFRSNALSLIINLLFTTIMFVILMSFMRYLQRFSLLIEDLKHGEEYIKSIPAANKINTGDVFPSNMKLTSLLNAYFKDNADYGGDIADYINEKTLDDEIHKSTTELAVSAMTGLGLLGTFVGLILGIKDLDINQDQLMESIKTLMNGMKTAFLTSIFGVAYSLIFNAIYKDLYSDGLKALDDFCDAFYDKVASNPDSRNMNQLLDYQSQMVKSLEVLPTALSAAITQEIDKVFTPTINKMDRLMEQFVSVATSNQQESLQILVQSFVDSMNQVLNDKFVMLAETLDKTCEMQTRNNELMNRVISETTTQLQQLSELNNRVGNALANIEKYISAIESYNDSIMNHNNETHKLITSVLESQNTTYSAVESMTKNITEVTSYVSLIENGIKELKALFDAFSRQGVELIKANASLMEKTNKETTDLLNQHYSETTTAMAALEGQINAFTVMSGDLIAEIKTVGSRIHTECSGLESSLGTSLNATFKVFDENLAEITTHLNSSIKEMQELVDRLPRDLHISIGKLKESMDQCVSLLNDHQADEEGN